MTQHHDTMIEAAKAAPPITVMGATIAGLPLQEWVLIGTAIYTAMLIIDKLPVVIFRIRQAYRWLKGSDGSNK